MDTLTPLKQAVSKMRFDARELEKAFVEQRCPPDPNRGELLLRPSPRRLCDTYLMKRPIPPEVVRAAKLSRVPGVTIAKACERFAVPRAAVERARRELGPETTPSIAELVLASLSSEGQRSEGSLTDLEGIAGWIDYINHDGCTTADVRRILDELVADGALSVQGNHWKLARPWP